VEHDATRFRSLSPATLPLLSELLVVREQKRPTLTCYQTSPCQRPLMGIDRTVLTSRSRGIKLANRWQIEIYNSCLAQQARNRSRAHGQCLPVTRFELPWSFLSQEA
jgi:hypothetical protein